MRNSPDTIGQMEWHCGVQITGIFSKFTKCITSFSTGSRISLTVHLVAGILLDVAIKEGMGIGELGLRSWQPSQTDETSRMIVSRPFHSERGTSLGILVRLVGRIGSSTLRRDKCQDTCKENSKRKYLHGPASGLAVRGML